MTSKEIIPAGSLRLADLTRNTSAVTGACMMVPRRIFDEVGGFDEDLRVVLNDVDLCLKIRQRGYLVVYTPHALLYHYEGSSRGRLHPPPDEKVFEKRWSDFLDRGDPYFHLADLPAYLEAQHQVADTFRQPVSWTAKTILNVARIGRFSIDRTVAEYASDIWGIERVR